MSRGGLCSRFHFGGTSSPLQGVQYIDKLFWNWFDPLGTLDNCFFLSPEPYNNPRSSGINEPREIVQSHQLEQCRWHPPVVSEVYRYIGDGGARIRDSWVTFAHCPLRRKNKLFSVMPQIYKKASNVIAVSSEATFNLLRISSTTAPPCMVRRQISVLVEWMAVYMVLASLVNEWKRHGFTIMAHVLRRPKISCR